MRRGGSPLSSFSSTSVLPDADLAPIVVEAHAEFTLAVRLTLDREIDAIDIPGPGPWTVRLGGNRYPVIQRLRDGTEYLILVLGSGIPGWPGPDAVYYAPPPGEPTSSGVPMVGPMTYLLPYRL